MMLDSIRAYFFGQHASRIVQQEATPTEEIARRRDVSRFHFGGRDRDQSANRRRRTAHCPSASPTRNRSGPRDHHPPRSAHGTEPVRETRLPHNAAHRDPATVLPPNAAVAPLAMPPHRVVRRASSLQSNDPPAHILPDRSYQIRFRDERTAAHAATDFEVSQQVQPLLVSLTFRETGQRIELAASESSGHVSMPHSADEVMQPARGTPPGSR